MRVKEEKQSPPPPPAPPFVFEAAGQRYAQTTEFRNLGGLVNKHGHLTREIICRIKAAWACFRRYTREESSSTGRGHRSDSRFAFSRRRRCRHCSMVCVTLALERVGCQTAETTVPQRRLLFAGAVAKQPTGRLPKPLMFGELEVGERPGRRCSKRNCGKLLIYRTTSRRSGRRATVRMNRVS